MKHFVNIFSIFILFFGTLSCDSGPGGTDPTGPDGAVNPDSGANPDATLPPDQTTPGDKYTVTVASVPESAQIWVDGENTGVTTPGDIEVEYGCYDFAVTLTGHQDWEHLFCIKKDETIGPVTLNPIADTTVADELQFLAGDWTRTDAIQSGPRNVTVSVVPLPAEWKEYYPDCDAFVSGFYPSADGYPAKKIAEDSYMIIFESGDGLETTTSTFQKNCTEIQITRTSGGSITYIYTR